MSSCSQLVELDALVMGELDARDARALRAHIETCVVCATEVDLLSAERALFERRAEALEVLAPPPALAPVAMPALSALGRIALRGHFTAACAAALFVVASLSRLGTASVSMALVDDVASMSAAEGAGSRTFASYREQEPLACGTVMDTTTGSSGHDGAQTSSSGGSQASPARGEALACVEARAVDPDERTCEPFTQARE